MRRLLALLGALVIVLALAPAVAVANDSLPHTGRVLISTSGDITVATGDQADAVIVVNGTATISGEVAFLLVVDGRVVTKGATLENIVVVRSTAELDGTTRVLNDVRTFDSNVTQAPGSRVDGSVGGIEGDLVGFAWFLAAAALVLWIGIAVFTLVAALVLAALAARQVRAAGALISHEPGKTALIGFLSLFVIPILAVLAMITLVGIPVGIALLVFVWPTLAFIGYLVAAIWIGEWLMGRSNPGMVRERPYLAAVLGVIVAGILGFIPVITFIISIFGLGAVILAGWRVFRGGSQQPTPAPAMGAPMA
jgi:hypothetical protein